MKFLSLIILLFSYKVFAAQVIVDLGAGAGGANIQYPKSNSLDNNLNGLALNAGVGFQTSIFSFTFDSYAVAKVNDKMYSVDNSWSTSVVAIYAFNFGIYPIESIGIVGGGGFSMISQTRGQKTAGIDTDYTYTGVGGAWDAGIDLLIINSGSARWGIVGRYFEANVDNYTLTTKTANTNVQTDVHEPQKASGWFALIAARFFVK